MYEGKDDSMMKKFMALFLALMFALLCTAAMAEGSTESVVSIPNGDHEVPATVCMPSGEGKFPVVVMLHGTGSNRDEAGNGYKMAAPVLAHRLILSPEARMRNMTAERVLSQVIGSVQVPVRTA